MKSRLRVEFDKRPDTEPIIWHDQNGGGELYSLQPGTIISVRHFGASMYLEIVEVRSDKVIEAVILELDDDLSNPDIIEVFEMNYILKLTADHIFTCRAPESGCLSVGPTN